MIAMRRVCLVAFVSICIIPLNAQQWFRANISLGSGIAITQEASFSAAVSGNVDMRAALLFGKQFGGYIDGGFAYQGPSAYTSDWFRYRGFFGLKLGGGFHYDFGMGDVFISAGAQLSLYDYSKSYFWFPYIEPAMMFPVWRIYDMLRIELGCTLPMYIRADCFTLAFNIVIRITYIQGASHG